MDDVEIITLRKTPDAKAPVYIRIEAASYAVDARATVAINGKEAWVSEPQPTGKSCGVNIMFLDPLSNALYSVTNCNICANSQEADKLAATINNAPYGTIIIAATFDEPTRCMTPAACQALNSIGVDTSGVPGRGRYAFVALKGFKERTKLVKSTDCTGTSVLEVCVTGAGTPESTTIDNCASTRIRIEAASYAVDARATVAINGKETWVSEPQPTGKSCGVNIMFLDPLANALYSVTNCNICANSQEADKLAATINNAPNGTIIIAATFDEPTRCMTPAACQALNAIGVDTSGVPSRGRYAFVALKGFKERTQLVKSTDSTGTSVLEVVVAGAGTPDGIKFETGAASTSNKRIRIEAASYAVDARATVAINGKEAWVSESQPTGKSCGVNIMFFNPLSNAVYSITNCNICANSQEADKLAATINNAPNGTIIIAVTFDEPTRCMTPAACQALNAIGVDTSGVPGRGRYAFVALKGFKERTQLVKSTDSTGTSVLDVSVTGAGGPENITFVRGSATSA